MELFVRTTAISVLALFMGLSAAAFVAAVAYFPVVNTNHGYTYSIVTPHSFVCYGIALLVALFALLADKLRADIASRLSLLPIVMIAGVLVFAHNLSEEGELWAARQAAFDAPSWKLSNQDGFWDEYSRYVGESHRGYYETWGAYFHVNDVQLFYTNIWNSSKVQAEALLKSAGQPIVYERDGVFIAMGALALQLAMSVVLMLRTFLLRRHAAKVVQQ
ncbi:hypothetical protein AO726_06600 [Pseudomonas sp. TTU2014-080ASC]|nr:hypothetical protein AO726_06600 [Pseudomonas sp. TTU2014-080ASC]